MLNDFEKIIKYIIAFTIVSSITTFGLSLYILVKIIMNIF